MGSIPTEVKEFFFTSCGLHFLTRAKTQWKIHGFTLALQLTLQTELIL